jgi:hypothetical protein
MKFDWNYDDNWLIRFFVIACVVTTLLMAGLWLSFSIYLAVQHILG